MNTKYILPVLIVIVLIAGGFYYSDSNHKDGVMMEENDSLLKDETSMMEEVSEVGGSGMFVKYEDVNISELEGKIVLDFAATWCPSCQAFKEDVQESVSDIPGDVNIVVVDYDKFTDLKKKYGVTTQHTFVQIDNNGGMIEKWIGGSALEDVLAKIK